MYILIFTVVLIGLLVYLKYNNKTEKFTAPSLTLSKPPLWFPQNSAEKYNQKKWHETMYLDRYNNKNDEASVYRFWKH